MRRLHQAFQFVSRDECHVGRTPPVYDHDFVIFANLIQDGRQVVPQTCISSLYRHPV